MRIRKIQLALLAATLVIAAQAHATLYDITFTGGSTTANGQIDVAGGVAISGFLDVTTGPNQGTGFTLAGLNYHNINGDQLGNDNLVAPASTPFLNDNGLGFGNLNQGFALWFNGANYTLWGYHYPGTGWGVPYENGSATLSLAAVPEPTTMIAGTLLLLPFGASTLRILRRNRAV